MMTMKSENIVTLDDLREFLTSYCEEYPEDDCCELIRDICEKNGWIYTADSEDISYDDEDYATDGEHILAYTSVGWEIFENYGQDIKHNGRKLTVREDGENWYVNFYAGLGEGVYPKKDWTFEKAINDNEDKCYADKLINIKKMTYDEYEDLSIQSPDEFWEKFDYFTDMENVGDMQYLFDFDDRFCGIGALNVNESVVAAWLPDNQYIFYDTSVQDVLRYILKNYPGLDDKAIGQELNDLPEF